MFTDETILHIIQKWVRYVHILKTTDTRYFGFIHNYNCIYDFKQGAYYFKQHDLLINPKLKKRINTITKCTSIITLINIEQVIN